MADKLTDKEEKMALHLADGLNQTQAYMAAGYSVSKMRRSVIHQQASRVANRERVRKRVDELRQEIANKRTTQAAWNKDKASNVLRWLISVSQEDIKKKGLRQSNANAIISAVKELNEINGTKELDGVRIENIKAGTEKIKLEISNLKGLDIEIEDMSDIEEEIYGES